MNRYNNIEIIKSDEGKRYYKSTIYPQITPKDNDIYVITQYGDRLDLISHDYYGDSSLWWIISSFNNIPKDSIYLPPGVQLRIPTDISNIIEEFNNLNNNR